jgi:chemotaxis protein CheD
MSASSTPQIKQTIMQGEARASDDGRVIMSTILGSCVATCLYDPVVRVGGMNHYLLAKPLDDSLSCADGSYGLYLMELLINEMLKLGADKRRMKARLYGGANMSAGLGRIGSDNAAFARQFLRDESIQTVFEDLEGTCARRIEYSPVNGLVRARRVTGEAPVPVKPINPIRDNPRGASQAGLGDVDLF